MKFHSLWQFAKTLTIATLYAAAGASPIHAGDPHLIYESKCADCHAPHAGEFVPDSLELREGALYGSRSGRPVRSFLQGGHGRLSKPEIDLLMDHFSAIQASGQVFQKKCAICHVRAVEVAREKLILRDGLLYGRYTGVETADFLTNHGRLTEDELPVAVEALKRQLLYREQSETHADN